MNYDFEENKWNQWLAGVIDGDGYLAIQKNNVAICEITMPLSDEFLLTQIKKKLGGHIRPRSGAKALRYRLSHKSGIIELIHRINGSIRNTIRIPQFKKLCKKFNISFDPAPILKIENGYMAGFFDADGTIYLSVRKASPINATQGGVFGKINRLYFSKGGNQVRISISNKYESNVTFLLNTFGFGKIYKKSYKNKSWYSWEVTNPMNILMFCDYLKKYPARSEKRKRLFLIERYFELKKIKAHLAPPGNQQNNAWLKFCKKWYLG